MHFFHNRSWSLSFIMFISEYFHGHVTRELTFLLHEQTIVMSSFRVCYTTFDTENKLTNMCLCMTKRHISLTCDYRNPSLQSCACDVTHMVAMQPTDNAHGCWEMDKKSQAHPGFSKLQIFLLWNAPVGILCSSMSMIVNKSSTRGRTRCFTHW